MGSCGNAAIDRDGADLAGYTCAGTFMLRADLPGRDDERACA